MNEQQKEKVRILIVDDDESICRTLSLILEAEGYETDIANTGKEAIEKTKTNFYNVALLDIKLPDMEGTKLLTAKGGSQLRIVQLFFASLPSLFTCLSRSLHDKILQLFYCIGPLLYIKDLDSSTEHNYSVSNRVHVGKCVRYEYTGYSFSF